MAKIIDGKKIAAEKESQLKEKVSEFVTKYHRHPKLVAVELSEDPASQLYLKLKRASAERIGIEFQEIAISNSVRQLADQISNLRKYDGIFLQHPPHFDKKKWPEIADQIPPEKDVDCLTTANLQLIKSGKPRFLPATVKAIEYCLERSDLPAGGQTLSDALQNKNIVILGRSPMVGLPLSWYLESLGVKVILLGSDTKNISDFTKKADILISTTGHPGLITGNMVKNGATIIDSGSPLGDVIFDEVAHKASAITPVPGGVGPLTVASLMENVVQSGFGIPLRGKV